MICTHKQLSTNQYSIGRGILTNMEQYTFDMIYKESAGYVALLFVFNIIYI